MTDATALEALAVRVEGGETGREIDFLVWETLEPRECDLALSSRRQVSPKGTPPESVRHTFMTAGGAPKFSTSLDAVAALAERVLPGCVWSVSCVSPKNYRATYRKPSAIRQPPPFYTKAPAECAARLASILRAKAKGG